MNALVAVVKGNFRNVDATVAHALQVAERMQQFCCKLALFAFQMLNRDFGQVFPKGGFALVEEFFIFLQQGKLIVLPGFQHVDRQAEIFQHSGAHAEDDLFALLKGRHWGGQKGRVEQAQLNVDFRLLGVFEHGAPRGR